MPGAGPGTPASPSICSMHGSAFWCWTARVPVAFADRQAVDALVDCYRRTISETEWQKYVQFYCPDGTKYC